jgi:hypothetical protein
MFKRLPQLLLILGIFTLINTGIASLSGVFSVLTGPPSAKEIKKQDLEMAQFIKILKEYDTSPEAMELLEKLQFITKAINDNYVLFTGVSLLISLAGLISVILMFRKNIYGFHLYIIYSLLSSTSMYLIISPADVPSAVIVVNLLISGLFIFLYSRNLTWLKSENNTDELK